jgi:predicted RNase H-like HicB family nuclease
MDKWGKLMVEVSIQIQKSELGYTAYCPEISEQRVQGASLDSVVSTMKEIIRDYLEHDIQPTSASTGESLLSMLDEITKDMTPEEIAQLPRDGAEQHDHYIYGSPKQ